MKNLPFYLGLSLLFTHELDSVANHEWRVIPGLNLFTDMTGEMIFLLVHVPIFALVISFVASLNLRRRVISRNVVCTFLIIHAGLHYLFSSQSTYEFSSLLSVTLIYGAAICGICYFVVKLVENRSGVSGP